MSDVTVRAGSAKRLLGIVLGAASLVGAIAGSAIVFGSTHLLVQISMNPWLAVVVIVVIVATATGAIVLGSVGRVLGVIGIVAAFPASVFVLALSMFIAVKPT
jgi:hypothetical protein